MPELACTAAQDWPCTPRPSSGLSDVVGVSRSWKLKNTTNQGFMQRVSRTLHETKCTYFKCTAWWFLTNVYTEVPTTQLRYGTFPAPADIPLFHFPGTENRSMVSRGGVGEGLTGTFFLPRVLYKWNHMVYILLFLDLLAQHVFEVQMCSNNMICLLLRIICMFTCIFTTQWVHPLAYWWTPGLVPALWLLWIGRLRTVLKGLCFHT